MTDASNPQLPGPGDIAHRLTDGLVLRPSLNHKAEVNRKKKIDRLIRLARKGTTNSSRGG